MSLDAIGAVNSIVFGVHEGFVIDDLPVVLEYVLGYISVAGVKEESVG